MDAVPKFLTDATEVRYMKEAEAVTAHGFKRSDIHRAENKDNRTKAAVINGRMLTVYYHPRCTCGHGH